MEEDLVDAFGLCPAGGHGLPLEDVIEQGVEEAEAEKGLGGVGLVAGLVELFTGSFEDGLVFGGGGLQAFAHGTIAVEEEALEFAVAEGFAALFDQFTAEFCQGLFDWLRPLRAGEHGTGLEGPGGGFGEFGGAFAMLCHGGHNGHAETLLEELAVDLQALFLGHVPAVEGDDHGHAEFGGL